MRLAQSESCSENAGLSAASNKANLIIQPKLTVGAVGDPLEHEADAMADKVMRMPEPNLIQRKCTHCEEEEAQRKPLFSFIQRKAGETNHTVSNAVHNQIQSTKGGGSTIPSATKTFMEIRFGNDFSNVRIHSGAYASQLSCELNAQAFTVGNDIYFNNGKFEPESSDGKRLLAHELTHAVQQGSAGTKHSSIQRAPTLTIMDQKFIGPLTATQRRAERSCPINCCNNNLGTLHAMPLFYHESRGAIVPEGSPKATGIGASLHFNAAAKQPPDGDLCHCDDFRMIQVLTSTHPADPRNNTSFVDNNPAGSPPFYGDTYLQGRGEHAIPGGYVDAGKKVTSTESIYDRPFRTTAMLGGTNLSWMAETCVSCRKNTGSDRVLGCVTYGFTQDFNAATGGYNPVAEVHPDCREKPSANFITTLKNDPTTSTYNFLPSPGFIECYNPGDFNVPKGNKRYA